MTGNMLCLDIGTVRIGIARANSVAKIPEPLTTIMNNNEAVQTIVDLAKQHQVSVVVVGLPRSLNGTDTDQTTVSRSFAKTLQRAVPEINIVMQDEALSSKRAKAYLEDKKQPYDKAAVDAHAACFILQDYLDMVK